MKELYHYGTKYHSGRYPYGSGVNPYQHDPNIFMDKVKQLRKEGLTEKEIAKYFQMTTREFKAERSLASNTLRAARRDQIFSFQEQGMSPTEIAKKLDIPVGTVRSVIAKQTENKYEITQSTIDVLKKEVENKNYIDIGKGVNVGMGITQDRLDTAVQALKNEGYEVYNLYVKQVFGTDQYTTVKVLAKPGISKKEVYENRGNIGLVQSKFDTPDSTKPIPRYKPVESISSKKIQIQYGDQGGSDRDGVIELRRGAEGLDLGNASYAQVRIAVDGKYFLKGMAVYADDLPDGIDIRFNTNKKSGTPAKDVFKPIEGSLDDPLAAFGTSIKLGGQEGYINKVYEEGDWRKWSKTIASQVLSKQPVPLAKKQLNAARLEQEAQYKEIMSLTNPVVKEYMLEQFAGRCDKASEELKAAAIPRQASHVILPAPSLKPNEVYAPNYKDGETVILIRYPHGGKFEIPELKVTSKNEEARKELGTATDAIAIHPSVAARLSGADFDGDTVLVIPNNNRAFQNSPARKNLQNFDPKTYRYPDPDSAPVMTDESKQKNMGIATNLIADMHLRGASLEEIERAVKYSMVVIDAQKHKLDYKQAYNDFNIQELVNQYQYHADTDHAGGASTLITRAGADVHIPKVKKSYRPDPETGKYTYTPAPDRTYIDRKTGEVKQRTTKTKAIYTVDDAYELSSGTKMEAVYADYANSMKDLAAQARISAAHVDSFKRDPQAAKTYKTEVDSLMGKIRDAEAHAPKERHAQLMAEAACDIAFRDNPYMSKEDKKDYKVKKLAEARASLGGTKPKVHITDGEWEAIQAHAVSKETVRRVMRYTDQDELKERALPRTDGGMTPAMLSRARARLEQGYTMSEVADSLGVSVSTLQKSLYE